MKILAIETSCDDTGVALLDIKKSQIKILADFVSSQNEIHAPYGGVVPNLAVRAHYKNLPILLENILAKVDPKKIDLIAVTIGPGLEPSLWAGVNTARVLAKAMDRPIVGVNHLEGHIAANFVGGVSSFKFQSSSLFPAICLIVSGGHTQLVLIKKLGDYKIIGQTRDDAAGEAFDKVAKMLGLGYPGGPEIALKAKKGDSEAFELPRPMLDSPDFDFSFSGLKTAVRYLLAPPAPPLSRGGRRGGVGRGKFLETQLAASAIPDLCASFQQAVVDVLVSKTVKAALKYKARSIMLSGGVAANEELRKNLKLKTCNLSAKGGFLPDSASHRQAGASSGKLNFLVPAKKFCADNAVMIGLAGYWKYQRNGPDRIENIIARANLNL